MAKQRSMNELRQEKTYGYRAPFGMTHEEEKPKGYSELDIDTTKELIVSNLSNEMYDTIFQAVNDEMAKHEVFQAETYLTPQGVEDFNEAWYEFYHDHFGDIMSDIFKSFTN
jgi:hypothetical protein